MALGIAAKSVVKAHLSYFVSVLAEIAAATAPAQPAAGLLVGAQAQGVRNQRRSFSVDSQTAPAGAGAARSSLSYGLLG